MMSGKKKNKYTHWHHCHVFLTQPLTNVKLTLKRKGRKFLNEHRGCILAANAPAVIANRTF